MMDACQDCRCAVRADGVRFGYRKDGDILRGVSLEVPEGAFWTIFGPSGAGKTTLMKVLAGLLPARQGVVELFGHRVDGHLPGWLRQQVGYIPQQLGLVRNLTALENVLLGSLGRNGGVRPLLGLFPKADVDRARQYLELLGIGHKADAKTFRLSGGERQRVAIARTLLQGPKIIFADEFISDLDLPRALQTLSAMRELARREKLTFVINLHEVEMMREMADHAVILREGAIAYQGPAGELDSGRLHSLLE